MLEQSRGRVISGSRRLYPPVASYRSVGSSSLVKSGPVPQRIRSVSDPESRQPWEISLAGDLSEKGDELLTKLVEVPFGSAGYIFFDSGGGSAYAGLALATTIRARGLRAVGVVAGECSSAALMPLGACRTRFVAPQATLLFHPIRWQSDEDMQLDQAAEWARHFQQMELSLDQLIADLYGLSLAQLHEWTRPGRFLTGREFAAAGLAHLLDLTGPDLREQLAAIGD